MSAGVEVVARERAAALARRPVDQAAVAEDDVVAVARRGSCRRRCRRGRCRRPPSVVIESEPPISDSIVVTRPSVIGSAPKRGAVEPAAEISPASPKTRLRPSPGVDRVAVAAHQVGDDVRATAVWPEISTSSTSSPSSPPMTMSSPAPVVIASLPPWSGSIVRIRSMSAGRGRRRRACRRARPRPSRSGRCRRRRCCCRRRRAIVSASMPPMTMSSPEPVVIESEPPISDSIVSTRPSVSGCEPKRAASETRRGDPAVVAEDEVVAVAGVDRVAVGEVALDV